MKVNKSPSKSYSRRSAIFVLSGCLLIGSAIDQGVAQTFPSRPIRIIVPFAAGGPNDIAARLVAEAMGAHVGQSVVVENRAGAGGLIGAETVARAQADGYTLLFGTIGPLVISPSAKALSYDPEKDFAVVGQVYRSAQVFSANPSRRMKSVSDFLSFAKLNPGQATIGTAGIGTLPHLTTELLKRDAVVNVTHVPYRGTNAALADLIAGQIDAIFGEVSVMAPNIESGKAVALAITSPERSKLLPSVPTMAEVGIPSLTVESWGGLLAPARLPADVQARLEQALQKALREPSFRSAADKQGWSQVTGARQEFADLLASETAKWRPVVRSPGFQLN
jgi:tripartite-type tricarboxylate transporter receptor subunit TctC